MKYMTNESCNVELATKQRSAENDEFQYVDTTSRPAVDSSGGVAYVIDKTLSRGTSGVDVSGIYRGTGHIGITITPSLSIPKEKTRNKARSRSKASKTGDAVLSAYTPEVK